MIAHDEKGLRGVAAAAHDLWFRPEEITYHEIEKRVTVPLVRDEVHRGRFGFRYYTPSNTSAGTLVFGNVRSLKIVDDAETEAYEVSSIVSEAVQDGMRITIFGGAPIRIEMEASAIAVRFDPPSPA